MNYRLSSNLVSFEEPYVHYCVGVEPSDIKRAIDSNYEKTKIVEIDGSVIPDLKSLLEEMNVKLGLRVRFDKEGGDDLHWTRIEDLVATDIEFDGNRGCVVIIVNAERALRTLGDGLIRLGQSMHIAGDENANPMQCFQSVKLGYAKKPRSVHTVFCYNRMPRNAPNANLIKIVA